MDKCTTFNNQQKYTFLLYKTYLFQNITSLKIKFNRTFIVVTSLVNFRITFIIFILIYTLYIYYIHTYTIYIIYIHYIHYIHTIYNYHILLYTVCVCILYIHTSINFIINSISVNIVINILYYMFIIYICYVLPISTMNPS